IKIGGFALSIAACLLIALYIKGELSYDRSYPTNHRIYRITGEYNNNGKLETGADWPPPMAKALREDFPEVEKAGRLMPHPLFYCAGSNQVNTVANEENTYEVGFTYADQDMLDILQVPMVYGDRTHALSEPNTIVLTKRKADKYFPNQNPVGKLMILNNDKNRIYKVGGVIQDFPSTSHIHYDFWLTMTGYELWKGEQSGWGSSNYYTYVLLKPGADATKFQSKLKLILTKYYLPMLLQDGNKDADQFTQKAKLLAQPITDVHLYSYNIDDGLEKGDIRFVWLFGAIAGFILVIACINFINVSKGQLSRGSKNSILRNGLVIFQFSTSIILIIGTLVIYKQTHYILNKKIGFNKDQVLLVQGANTLENKTLSFKNELLKSADIKNVSISDYLPVSGTKRD